MDTKGATVRLDDRGGWRVDSPDAEAISDLARDHGLASLGRWSSLLLIAGYTAALLLLAAGALRTRDL
ncbi:MULTISPECIES: hypothetical protein [unclassified Streptomyces]|uniref:hypothetical protein n=1 Tax=unclassified Streptomyces TaxID=2593676 RepID=UPI00365B0048